ncbi:MAG: hypothetical protein KatS3mg060_3103 [Dehalococcoidia bacterium]|nr:MAG: hypothetical protein KatS3mg060_3103 [Dehalococcoidia bacterium]
MRDLDLSHHKIKNGNMGIEKIDASEDFVPRVLGACPVCGRELRVRRLHCVGCSTAIEGDFALGRLQNLNPDQIRFVEVFLKNRGKIKDVEQELHISYPTVVARLNEVIQALGFAVAPEPDDRSERRREVLDQLAAGQLTAAQAAERLRRL